MFLITWQYFLFNNDDANRQKVIRFILRKCQGKLKLRCQVHKYYRSTAVYDRLTLNSGYRVCSLLKNLRIWYTVRVKC